MGWGGGPQAQGLKAAHQASLPNPQGSHWAMPPTRVPPLTCSTRFSWDGFGRQERIRYLLIILLLLT